MLITPPEVLFLDHFTGADANYYAHLFPRLAEAGYISLIEPCAGTFRVPQLATQIGFPAATIHTSDVNLYSAVCGRAFAGDDPAEVGLKLDGRKVRLSRKTIMGRAAELLYAQLKARMEERGALATYWSELVTSIRLSKREQVDGIQERLTDTAEELEGVSYRDLDPFEHIEEVRDRKDVVISLSPPADTGFEKFYNTGGRLTWEEPEYRKMGAVQRILELVEMTQKHPALLILKHHHAKAGATLGPAVYARHAGLDSYTYIVTNRQDEVRELAGGLWVAPIRSPETEKLDLPIIAPDHEISEKSTIKLAPVSARVSAYYRDLWMHKLDYKSAANYIAVAIDGCMAGLMGFDKSTIYRPYNDRWKGCLLVTFSVGAPHSTRLTRLITMLALSTKTWEVSLTQRDVALASRGAITAQFTPYPESKGLRGLMKLESRTKDPKYGYRLIYFSERRNWTPEEARDLWLKQERNRAKELKRNQQRASGKK